jgi:hypothetical protein
MVCYPGNMLKPTNEEGSMARAKFACIPRLSMILFLATGLIYSSTISSRGTQERIQRQALAIRTLAVSSVEPKEITLLRGGDEVSATISGSFLNYATSAHVVVDGNVVTQITAKLSQTWPNPSTVTFNAQSNCPAGTEYQLKLLGSASSSNWTVGLDKLRIKVSTSQAQLRMTTAQKTATPVTSAPSTKQLAPRYEALKKPLMATLGTDDLEKILTGAFSGASYSANACGGSYANRKTKIQISHYYNKEEPLPRLSIELPYEVKQATTREGGYRTPSGVLREARLRACVDGLTTYPWKGFVESGKFKVRMQFRSNLFIKTRVMQERKSGSGWKDDYDWNDASADKNIPDYFYIALCLDLYLTPVVQNGVLTYGAVEVKWFWAEDRGYSVPEGAWVQDPWDPPHGHPYEKSEIDKYKQQVMDILSQRIKAAFENSNVRNGLQHGLTNYVKTGELAKLTIKSIAGSGGRITVTFE